MPRRGIVGPYSSSTLNYFERVMSSRVLQQCIKALIVSQTGQHLLPF
jgi:hypothetical protein